MEANTASGAEPAWQMNDPEVNSHTCGDTEGFVVLLDEGRLE